MGNMTPFCASVGTERCDVASYCIICYNIDNVYRASVPTIRRSTCAHATYEIGSPTVSKILSVDYGYFLNADFTRKGRSMPAIGKRAIGKPRIIAPVRTATPQEDGTMRAVPKSEIRKAQAGTLGYRR
jgi:hypothetical protein